jgi:hypothetical protein
MLRTGTSRTAVVNASKKTNPKTTAAAARAAPPHPPRATTTTTAASSSSSVPSRSNGKTLNTFFPSAGTWQAIPNSTYQRFVATPACIKAVKRAAHRMSLGQPAESADRRDLSENTVITNVNNLKRARKALDLDEDLLVDALLTPHRTVDMLSTAIKAPATLKSTIGALIAVLKESGIKDACGDLYAKWKQAFAPIRQQAAAGVSPADGDALDWEADVLPREKAMHIDPKTKFGSYHLLLAFVCLVPPRRPKDYSQVLLVGPGTAGGPEPSQEDIDKAAAYIDLRGSGPPRMVIRRFKTAKSQLASRKRKAQSNGQDPDEVIEPFETELPEDLAAVLRGSLARVGRRYLFPVTKCNRSKKYDKVTSFNKWSAETLTKVMGRPASFNDFRHAFITWLYKQNPTMGQLLLASDLMAHNLRTQLEYRTVSGHKPIKGLDG